MQAQVQVLVVRVVKYYLKRVLVVLAHQRVKVVRVAH